jgi:DNA-binding HxlR family transcriptional regulator
VKTSPTLRSPCPVAATLDLLGDRWTLLIIRDLYSGKSRYRDLLSSPEKIATNILASRLESLTTAGLITTKPSPVRANTAEYHLTAKGRSLLPILQSLRDWGLANIRGTKALISVPNP